MIEVRLAAPLRPLVSGASSVKGEGKDIDELIANLDSCYPGIRDRILEPDGSIKPFINIFLNNEDIRFLQGIHTLLRDGDVVAILPAVVGGMKG